MDAPASDNSRRMSHLRRTLLQRPALLDAAYQTRKPPAIVGVLCTTPAVPPCEVQAIVAPAMLVMHVMVQSRGEPASPPSCEPASRLEFDTAVTGDVAHHLICDPDEQNRRVRGHEQQEQWQERGLHDGLADGERVRRPLRRRHGEM